ncbi:MAG: sigma-54-dependent Fis family transcriptional regulator [Candidatus Tectomicrobia bacterium]
MPMNEHVAAREKSADTYRTLLRLCQQMNTERDLSTLLELIAREAARLMGAERASIFLLDQETHELWSQVALGSEPIRFAADLGIAGATVQTGQVHNVSDVQADPRFYPAIDTRQGYQTQNLLAVPLQNYEGEMVGAFEVLNKHEGAFTSDDEELLTALAAQAAIAIETAQFVHALRQRQDNLLSENRQLWQAIEDRFATNTILGTSAQIQRVVQLIERLRGSNVSVLITGESGTGKELVAKALHYTGLRARESFVALNCAALPDNLIESELFGIERGVATGVERRGGKFEEANGGTLFLDEIGDLSLQAQAKILRALQERTIERVGGRKAIPIDVRIIAATNKDLDQAIEEGVFREDLYYRLNVIHLHVPPLRERLEDLLVLAQHFLATYCQDVQQPLKRLSPAARRGLRQYTWPGNVRELENAMKRLVVLSPSATITAEDVITILGPVTPATAPEQVTLQGSLHETVEAIEKQLIREALQSYQNNKQQTARALGLSRQGLLKKLKRYQIEAA